jgi:cytochrome c peroxidase
VAGTWERRASVALIATLSTAWFVAGLIRLFATRAPVYRARPEVAATADRHFLESQLDSLAVAVQTMGAALTNDDTEARRSYRIARRLYKQTEFLTASYAPTTAARLNGPAESDDSDAPPQALGQRSGFGVVEEALFGDVTHHAPGDAKHAVDGMLHAVSSFRDATRWLDVSDSTVLDAARLELTRIMTVGIAGADAELSGDALAESASAVDGIIAGIRRLESPRIDSSARDDVVSQLGAAAGDLRSARSFETFDRFRFIATRGMPAARAVLRLRRLIDARPSAARRLWRPEAATPFDRGAFDVWALAPEYSQRGSQALTALGARLFGDSQISGPRTRSCATCHQRRLAFTDGLRRARAFDTAAVLRNTPTLLNAALQPAMFADQRAGFVEDQIQAVLTSGAEMASSPALAAQRVRDDSSYASPVRRALGPSAAIDERAIRMALAAYVRSLTALDAPFDRAIRGDSAAMGDSAKRGFNVFMGKARCGTCHFAPLFGGTAPPEFTRSELESIGVPASAAGAHPRLDADVGRERVDGLAQHRGAFRVPMLRNVAVTAPYMHNGVFRTLDEVIDFYDRGGGVGVGVQLETQTLPARPIRLSPTERGELLAFLHALTDTVPSVAKP